MKSTTIMLVSLSLFVFFISQSCKENDETVKAITDEELVAKLLETGYTNYSNDTIAANGPHTPFVFVKFNAIASTALNSSNEIETGESFPEGAIIVKELFNSKGGALVKRFVMYKKSDDPNAAISWVWASYSNTNTALNSVTGKGVGCFECHSANPNRDGVKLFDAH